MFGLPIFVFDTVMFYSYQTSQWPRLTNKARGSFKWLNPYGSCGFYVAKIDVMGLKNVDETRKGSRYKEANHPQCTPSATRPFSTWLSINLLEPEHSPFWGQTEVDLSAVGRWAILLVLARVFSCFRFICLCLMFMLTICWLVHLTKMILVTRKGNPHHKT